MFNGMNGLEILNSWPRFDDGARVKFGDVVSDGDETGRVYYVTFDTVNPVIIGFTDEEPDRDPGTWLEVSVSDGERVKRPADILEPVDTWQRIEEDLGDEMAKQQCGPISPELACRLAGEFVRRCKALAEQERGE